MLWFSRLSAALPAVLLATCVLACAEASQEKEKVLITIVDKQTDKPVPCRIHLKDPDGKPVFADKLPYWRDHFVCPGTVQLTLAKGKYAYEIERGPEYAVCAGNFTVGENEQKEIPLELTRLINLSKEGWWPGELHVHRPIEDCELLMQAEDLYVCPVITWWNARNLWANKPGLAAGTVKRFDTNRYLDMMAGEDERGGGALLYFGLKRPLAISGAVREYPSAMKFLLEAAEHAGVWIDVEKPFWWDMPTWLASGKVHSLGIANNHMCRSEMSETEAWGKARDLKRLPRPRGNGYWSQEIYYHVLNTGMRLPPSAGSASGVLPNPVGYNRVYVHGGPELDYAKWWEGLRAGRSFVTNGPLLRVQANGKLPGQVFSADAGQSIKIDLKADITTRDTIPFIEIIKNGRVERKVAFDDWSKSGSLGSLTFAESGWFLVRTVADNPKTFRFASTAPFYVEIGKMKRVSKASAQFFVDWVEERADRLKLKLDDPAQRQEVLGHFEMARKFWRGVAEKANAE